MKLLKFYFIFRVLCYTCMYTDKWDLLCFHQDVWETHSSISGFVRVRAGDIFQSQRSRKTTLTNYRSDVIIELCLCFTIVGKKNYKNKNSIGMHVYNWIKRFKCLPYVYMQIIIKSNLSSSIILSTKHIVYSIKYNWRKKWWKYNLVWNIYSSQWSEGKKISCLLTLKPGMYICSC